MTKNTRNINERIAEDEIDLRELFLTLWNKKIFISVFTTIITVLSIIFTFSKTPIYEIKAILEVGSISNNNNSNNNNNNNNNHTLLENTSSIINKINIIYNINISKNEVSKLNSIKLLKRTEDLIEISVYSTTNVNAEKKINEIINRIKSKHEIKIKNYQDLLSSKFDNSNREYIRLKNEQKSISNDILKKEYLINELLKTSPAVAAVYSINLNTKNVELLDVKNRMYKISEDLSDIKSLLLPSNIKETQILGSIIKNDYPIKPKKKVIFAVALGTSFILSIFLVFFMNFIQGFKEESEDK